MLLRITALLFVVSMMAAYGCGSDDPAPVAPKNPECEVSTSALAFGDVNIGDMFELSINIRNAGGGTLRDTVRISGDAEFTITAGGGAFSLGENESRRVTVKFMPTGVGAKAATLTFTDPGCGTVNLTGTGILVSVSLNPSKDNTLVEFEAGDTDTLSNGKGQYLFAGRVGQVNEIDPDVRRALMHFDIAGSVPANATIDSVFLTINVSRVASSASQTFTLHKVTSDWGEGESRALGQEGGGIAAEPGDATWLHTFYNTGLWTTEGGDFVAGPSVSFPMANLGMYTISDAGMTDDVQAWLDAGATNFGWIMLGNEVVVKTAKRFDSKDHLNAANRPTLQVYYTP